MSVDQQSVERAPTCVRKLLDVENEETNDESESSKLGLRNTEIIVFWEPNPVYNVVPPNGSCDADFESIYDIYLAYIKAEMDGIKLSDEDGEALSEPIELSNIMGGAKAHLLYGTLKATINLPQLNIFSWGGTFQREVKMEVPGLGSDHPCKKDPAKTPPYEIIPPCPETSAGFTIGSLESRIIDIDDSIAEIKAVKDNLFTYIEKSNLYDSFIDSKILMHGEKITLDAVQINADNLLIQEYSMFKDVNISAKGHVILSGIQPFYVDVDASDPSEPSYTLEYSYNAFQYGYVGGTIDTGTEGSLYLSRISLSGVTITSSSLAGGMSCKNCTVSLAVPEPVTFLERLDAIAKNGLDADPLLTSRRDGYNKISLCENQGLGYSYICNDFLCPERFEGEELTLTDEVCTDNSRSGCLEYKINPSDLVRNRLNIKYELALSRVTGTINYIDYDDGVPYDPKDVSVLSVRNTNELSTGARLAIFRDTTIPSKYQNLPYYHTLEARPFRFGASFDDSFVTIDGDLKTNGIVLVGSSVFTVTRNIDLTNGPSTSDAVLNIQSPARAEINHIGASIRSSELSPARGYITLGDQVDAVRPRLDVNGFLSAELENARGGEVYLHRTYAYRDYIFNGVDAIINFTQPIITLEHKNQQRGTINFNNAIINQNVSYLSGVLTGGKLFTSDEVQLNLGGTDQEVRGRYLKPRIHTMHCTLDVRTISTEYMSGDRGNVYNVQHENLGPVVVILSNDPGALSTTGPIELFFQSSRFVDNNIRIRPKTVLRIANSVGTISDLKAEGKFYVTGEPGASSVPLERRRFSIPSYPLASVVVTANSFITITNMQIDEFDFHEGSTIIGTSFICSASGRTSNLTKDNQGTALYKSLATLAISNIEITGLFILRSRAVNGKIADEYIGALLAGKINASNLNLKYVTLAPNEIDAGSTTLVYSSYDGIPSLSNAEMSYYSMNRGTLINSRLIDSANKGTLIDCTLTRCRIEGIIRGKTTMTNCSEYNPEIGYFWNTPAITLTGGRGSDLPSIVLGIDIDLTIISSSFNVKAMAIESSSSPDSLGKISIDGSIIKAEQFFIGDITIGSKSLIQTVITGLGRSTGGTGKVTTTYADVLDILANELSTIGAGGDRGKVELVGSQSTLRSVSCGSPVKVAPNNRLEDSFFKESVEMTNSKSKNCVFKHLKLTGGQGASAFEWHSDDVTGGVTTSFSSLVGPNGESSSPTAGSLEEYSYEPVSKSLVQGGSPSFFIGGNPVNTNLSLLRRFSDDAEPLPKVPLEYTNIIVAGNTTRIVFPASFVDLRNSWNKKIHRRDKIYTGASGVGEIIGYSQNENSVTVNGIISSGLGQSLFLEGRYGGGPVRTFIDDPGVETIQVATPTAKKDPTTFLTKNKNKQVVASSLAEAKMIGQYSTSNTTQTNIRFNYADQGSVIGWGTFTDVNINPSVITGRPGSTVIFTNCSFQGALGPNSFLFKNSLHWGGSVADGAELVFEQSVLAQRFGFKEDSSIRITLKNTESFGRISSSIADISEGSVNYGDVSNGNISFRGSENIGRISDASTLDFTSSANYGEIENCANTNFIGSRNIGTIENRDAFDFLGSDNAGLILTKFGTMLIQGSTNAGRIVAESIFVEGVNPSVPATVEYAGGFFGGNAHRPPPVLHLGPMDFTPATVVSPVAKSDCEESLKKAVDAGLISDTGGQHIDIIDTIRGKRETLGYTIYIGAGPDQIELVPDDTPTSICFKLASSAYRVNYMTGGYTIDAVFPDAVQDEGLWYDSSNFLLSQVGYVLNDDGTIANGLYATGIHPLDVFPRGTTIAEQVIMPLSGVAIQHSIKDNKDFDRTTGQFLPQPVMLAQKYIFKLDYENDRPTGYN